MELGPVTGKNFNNVSEILSASFPVRYESDFFASLERSDCQFAYLNDFLIGCIVCRRDPLNVFYVLALATLAPYRRLGVASALLQWAETRALSLGCSQISLHVRASDAVAIAFYQSRGFVQTGRIAGYYPLDGDADALLLAKQIPA